MQRLQDPNRSNVYNIHKGDMKLVDIKNEYLKAKID